MTISRRVFLGGTVASIATRALAQTPRLIPQRVSARVIVDNDLAGDPDGLVALAHQLLAPKTRTVLITTSALDAELTAASNGPVGRTAAAGREKAQELLRRMALPSAPSVIAGSETFGIGPAQVSDAARAIVSEAMRDDPLPLYFTCGGPLTNLAAALRLEPAIARRMTVVWIGGVGSPAGGKEYNLATDAAAARQVIEQSTVPFWQVPGEAYGEMRISIAEMNAVLRPISPLSLWIYDQYLNLPPFVNIGGTLTFGDSPLVLLTAISGNSGRYSERTARRIAADFRYGEPIKGRRIRVYEKLDVRLTLADFVALLRSSALSTGS
jgi:hypothetical protein